MSDKLQGYIDDLSNKRKILTKGEFVKLSPGATKEILEILILHKEVLEQLEQAQQDNKELQRRDFVVSKASETLGRYVREAQEERDQLRVILKGVREQNQKLIEAMADIKDQTRDEESRYIAEKTLQEVQHGTSNDKVESRTIMGST
ncbi:MAG: hypothetical protein NAG76_22295 [Candidatus Pristimantibacillus lignocellulolyticus]|uniref:Uncharacterized protein n=1 Tax=Candidatus Pristimantibacillus lignocellulolyticus TaxID=2994561 RepID=A0A9J6ZFF3_9BACL|nr:MAG: hypothetical protein NAG76_22295 [Candidatus Pristimantibacillus lignocellulolyticus]